AWCIHVSARRLVAIRYRRLVVPLVALLPPVCVPLVAMPRALLLLLPAVLLVAHPSTRRELAAMAETARATLARRRVRSPRAAPGAPGAGADMDTYETPQGQPEPTAARFAPYAPPPPPSPYTQYIRYTQHEAQVAPAPPPRYAPYAAPPAPPEPPAPPTPPAGPVDLLAETDPLTGSASPAVLLARLGRTLGVACEAGWSLGLVALELAHSGGSDSSAAATAGAVARIAAALRAELRFDDVVARVGPGTFVVAVLLLDRDDDGAAVAAHLDAAVRAAVPDGARAVRAAHLVVPLPSELQADVLVRQVLGAVRG
ncbi:MAG: hypothetical protein ACRDV8_00970, partial [Acidimicrobiales bacterium]